jgi:hypothetical protein
MSDGGEDGMAGANVLASGQRALDRLVPHHITLRITVLQQRTKSLQGEVGRADTATKLSRHIDT